MPPPYLLCTKIAERQRDTTEGRPSQRGYILVSILSVFEIMCILACLFECDAITSFLYVHVGRAGA